MRNLRDANIQKCLDILKKFHDAVPVDGSNKELKMKKVEVGQAIDHLDKILAGDGGGSVPKGPCKTDPRLK